MLMVDSTASLIISTRDAIIVTFCIENGMPLLYSDRNFDPFVKHLGLKNARRSL